MQELYECLSHRLSLISVELFFGSPVSELSFKFHLWTMKFPSERWALRWCYFVSLPSFEKIPVAP